MNVQCKRECKWQQPLKQPSLLLVVFEDHYLRYLESCLVVSETLNCKHEIRNSQDLYALGLRKYGTTVGHVLCVISCIQWLDIIF